MVALQSPVRDHSEEMFPRDIGFLSVGGQRGGGSYHLLATEIRTHPGFFVINFLSLSSFPPAIPRLPSSSAWSKGAIWKPYQIHENMKKKTSFALAVKIHKR